ncbi:hypothetical protein [Pseudactinotalea sp. HY158]|uniref:hypothetical protein n=1 Tax=Pseudactinotalea sp. HY158 TaxID=2654547 RepID=UPI00129CB115|nr:hypothetical protein [Pseudactinotalea sp. HY158]QGH69777.1 hypothetical protein GCE65_09825 [Pseudactinotalea sp. HY158]
MTDRHPEHPDAGAELFDAAQRYEQIQPGLGHALFEQVALAISAIEQYPDGWTPLSGWDREPIVRTKGIRRFNYRIVYFQTLPERASLDTIRVSQRAHVLETLASRSLRRTDQEYRPNQQAPAPAAPRGGRVTAQPPRPR